MNRIFNLLSLFLVYSFYAHAGSTESKYAEYENKPIDLIGKFTRKDPVIVEAGGHYGIDTLKFVKKWPTCSVHTFEPNPHAFDYLLQNTKHLSNVFQYNLAIGDINGKAPFYISWGPDGDNYLFEGASSLLPTSVEMKDKHKGPVIDVECITLDEWSREQQIYDIDVLWLDLGGFEIQALYACPNLLSMTRVIYVKTNLSELRVGMTQFIRLRNFLEKKGFYLLNHWHEPKASFGSAIFVKYYGYDTVRVHDY